MWEASVWAWTVGFLGLLFFTYSNSWRLKKKLPPGSMGWPLIGELPTYIPMVRSEKPYEFTKQKESKYGPVFKTSLLTGKTIMITDVEGVKFVLQNESIFQSGYPKSLKNVLGKYAMMFEHGEFHKRMHAMIRRFVSSTPLKKHLTRELEILTTEGMLSWPHGERMFLADETQKITHNFLMKQLFGIGPGRTSTTILQEFRNLMKGIIGIPIMIPGTPYYNAMKAREKLIEIIRNMMESRVAHPEIEYKDILQSIIEEKREGEPNELIYDNVFICLVNGQGVPSAIITLAVKNLSECPEALKQIREENLAIRKGKAPEEGLSWNDYMSLEFTQAVFNETLRLANGAQGVMRSASRDVVFRGYIIPKGWTVLPYFLNIHFEENMYPNPTKFHPWRWLEKNIPSTYFLPFGGGTRICPGQELGRLQTAVFLHHLVTKFKWEAEPDTVINFPVVRTKNRLPIMLQPL